MALFQAQLEKSLLLALVPIFTKVFHFHFLVYRFKNVHIHLLLNTACILNGQAVLSIRR